MIHSSRQVKSPTSSSANNGGNKNNEREDTMMMYYMIAGNYLRPVGFINGTIVDQYDEVTPYSLRRSCGEIDVVLFCANNTAMMYDYTYVMEKGIASRNTTSLTVVAKNNSLINVFGEMFGGYTFQAPTRMVLNGSLNIAYWTSSGLAEEPAACNALVEVNDGVLNLIICDHKQIVLIYDTACNFCINIIQDEGEQMAQDGTDRTNKVGKLLSKIQKLTGKADQQHHTNVSSSTPGKIGKQHPMSTSDEKLNSSQTSQMERRSSPKVERSMSAQIISSLIKDKSRRTKSKVKIARKSKSSLMKRKVKKDKSKLKLSKSKFNIPKVRSKTRADIRRDETESKDRSLQDRRSVSNGSIKSDASLTEPNQPKDIGLNQLNRTRIKAELSQLVNDIRRSASKTKSREKNNQDDRLPKDVINMKEKLAKIIEGLHELLESIPSDKRKCLQQDLNDLHKYSGNLTPERFHDCKDQIATLSQKIATELNNYGGK
ncbi:hypothetical protein RDWZM_000450 [Blomia tropicalis]|uniref:Uncharacterized protein n=1 Tax=Blomia tropicalis TaxID=40697 RepID=A0A9Q0RPT0_BLOTA|nr:hypothetical protein RDWZM_000450 [Blomia tropicalis]